MKKYKLIKIITSLKKEKKYMAIFKNIETNREKKIHFGAKGMEDYTIHKDSERKERYLNRHRKNENWNDPITAGSLSRWILWNKPTIRESINDYKKRFGF